MEKLTVLTQITPKLYKCAVVVLYANFVVVRAVRWVLVRRCDIFTLSNKGRARLRFSPTAGHG